MTPLPPRQTCCITVTIAGRPARIASFLPRRGWSLSEKGYLIYTSRGTAHGIKRGTRAHVLTVRTLNGGTLAVNTKILMTDRDALNPSPTRRDPYTGLWLSAVEWHRRYRVLTEIREYTTESAGMPDWVVHEFGGAPLYATEQYCE